MMEQLLSKIATTTIFWASDFSHWRDAESLMYSTIDSISTYGYFRGFATNYDVSPTRFNAKYAYFLQT